MSDILRARMESHIHGARRIRFGIIVVIMSIRLVAALGEILRYHAEWKVKQKRNHYDNSRSKGKGNP